MATAQRGTEIPQRTCAQACDGQSPRPRFTSRMSLPPLDWLDIMRAAVIPRIADPGASGLRKRAQQVRQQAIAAVRGDQLVSVEGGLPVALATSDQDDVARLIAQPIERPRDCALAASARA